MMKCKHGMISLLLGVALNAGIVSLSPQISYAQDKLITLSGNEVPGQITAENEDEVYIKTQYGDLRFFKRNLKTVIKANNRDLPPVPGGAPVAASDDPSSPFGGESNSAGSSPSQQAASGANSSSSTGSTANMFLSQPPGASTGGSAAPAANPFGSSASNTAASSPFGGSAAPSPSSPFGNSPGSATNSAASTSGSSNAPAATNPFGSQPASSASSPFGGGSNSTSSQTTESPFGGNFSSPSSTSTNPFGSSSNSSGAGASPASPFGASPSGPSQSSGGAANPFSGGSGSQAPATNPFGSPGTSSPSSNSATSPFNTSSSTRGSPAPTVPQQVAQASQPVSSPPSSPSESTDTSQPSAPKAIPALFKSKKPPEVQSGFDAVVYGVHETFPVEIKPPSAEAWASVSVDSQLKRGSEVRTNETPTSRMVLRGTNDEIRLPKQSHLAIEELSANSEEVVLNLIAGSVWTKVQPRSVDDAFRVKTPELTAGVRGTTFRVDRIAGASKVSVFEGTVHVTANKTNVSVTLKENESAVVNLQGQIMDKIAIPVDEAQIWQEWDQWAQETTVGSGSLAAGAGITAVDNLSQQVAQDNARWEADMQQYMRNVAELKFQEKLDEYANAFMKFAEDTGYIPEDDEGWSMLKFDPGLEGWNGPYVEGAVPPLDPWKRPLVYVKTKSRSNRVFGKVYSFWQDGRDQGGTNASVDKFSLIMYFRLDRFQDDPEVNPQ